MSNDMQELTEGKEDISNRARGYKAAISNPSTSSLYVFVLVLALVLVLVLVLFWDSHVR